MTEQHGLLHLTCSPRGEASFSRRIGAALVDRLVSNQPELRVIKRDLAAAPPPAIDAALAAALVMPEAERGPTERAALTLSERLIGELEATDLLVLDTPMHNYSVPASLKAWIDHVVRIRRTFESTPQGKVGLLRDRPALIVTASAGYHSAEPARQPDFLTPYLSAIFRTIGITNLAVLHLEGMGRGPDAVARALCAAEAWIAGR